MQLPKRDLKLKVVAAVLIFLFSQAATAASLGEGKPIHATGDKELWNRKANRVELIGHAVVTQPTETITADYIFLDLNSRTLDARGNCVYLASDSYITSEEMHFNIDTRTGTITKGRVSNDRFSLAGERINKLGDGRFQAHWGEYTTCRDCPQSWSLQGEDIDIQFDGYAYMSNVTTKIKDTPAFWIPYLIVPIKTRRQTGFLFPEFGIDSINGLKLVEPFFWAINRSFDATIGAGTYTGRGPRVELEGRYVLAPRSAGRINFNYINDSYVGAGKIDGTVPVQANRFGLDIAQTQELPYHLEEKLRLTEISDNLYPIDFRNDVPGYQEPVLTSALILSYSTSDLSAYVAAERFRNLLTPTNVVNQTTQGSVTTYSNSNQFDPRTVQALPKAEITTNSQFIGDSPFIAGLTVDATNFTRTAGDFDLNFDSNEVPTRAIIPGVDPIRRATRVSLTPSVYTTIRAADTVSIVPSLEYRSYFYNFGNTVDNLNRSYLVFQTDLSTQLEKIFDTGDPAIPHEKHLIRPIVRYSYIPYVREDSSHPFVKQIQFARTSGFSGYNFDDSDITPLDSPPTTPGAPEYFYPLGNSLTLGLTTQLIRRRGAIDAESAAYQRILEFSAGQSINLREYQKCSGGDGGGCSPQPFSRFFSALDLNFDHFISTTSYLFYPYVSGEQQSFSTSATLIFERAVHQRVLNFDRSVTLNYVWNQVGYIGPAGTNNLTLATAYSLNDYLQPNAAINYDFVNHVFFNASAGLLFQSPSQCWRMNLSGAYDINNHQPTFNIDLSLNLTGTGFGGVTEVANQTQNSNVPGGNF